MKKIAIIGMSCQFPGGANSLEKYWQLLVQKKDAIVEVPSDRWDTRKFYSKHDSKPGKAYVKEAGFLETSVYDFDPLFFGITPREAEAMDPQQRLLLQTTWNAIEDAGLTIESLQKEQTGVFVGCFTLDNMLTQLGTMNMDLADGSTPTSSTMAIVANRVSHVFNFKGPSLAVDTACSSSLVSTHLACQSLLTGESDIAIAAGVNVITRPEYPTVMSKGNFLSKHGRCKTFDQDAGGYTRGEGVGTVILKPFEKAVADGDRIYSVICASGLNQDGATVGIASPNGESQENLIRSVYQKANVHPNDIQYVEAHGTGTQAGDTTETGALGRIFKDKTNGKIFVGSVKSNIGHLEASAGIAGLIKTSLCLYKSKLVPNLHFETPNPKIDFEKENISVLTENQHWPKIGTGEKRRASINSFGYGGTNAHLLLESHANFDDRIKLSQDIEGEKYLIPVSAKSKEALKEAAGKLSAYIKLTNLRSLSALSDNLLKKRSLLSNSFSFWSNSIKETASILKEFSKGRLSEKGLCEEKTKTNNSKIAFVMTGMGPQWQGMGKEYYDNNLTFRKTLDNCDQLFTQIAGWSLLAEMFKEEGPSRMNETAVAQPANFFIQAGLMAMLKEMGFTPDAFIGHSVGEVASAYCSGMLSLEAAILVSYHRSRLQQTTAGLGTMLALGINQEAAKELMKNIEFVDIAAVNSSNAVTLAGEKSSLEEINQRAIDKKIFSRFLTVEVAYHSYQMDAIHEEILEHLKNLKTLKPTVPLYSTVTGEKADGEWDNQYWWSNVRSPVQFDKTIKTMINEGFDHFVEIGPHPVLKTSLEGIFKETNIKGYRTHTFNRKENELLALENASSWLYSHGFSQPISRDTNTPFLNLPSYPWQNEEYKRETKATKEYLKGSDGNVFVYHETDDTQPTWSVEFNDGFFPFVEDHVVQNNIVFPGACYVEAGLAIANELKEEGETFAIEGLDFTNMLVANHKEIQMLKSSYDIENRTFTVRSKNNEDEAEWKLHAKGKVFYYEQLPNETLDLYTIKKECEKEIDVEELYKKLKSIGLDYGQYFKSIVEIETSKNTVVSRIKGDQNLEWDENFYIQPALLDACFQSMIGLVDLDTVEASYVPVHIEEILFSDSPGLEFNCVVKVKTLNSKEILGDIFIVNDFGQVLTALKGVRCKAINQKQTLTNESNLSYKMDWVEKELTPDALAPHQRENVLVITETEDSLIKNANWLNYFDSVLLSSVEETAKFKDQFSQIIYFINNNQLDLTLRFKYLKELLMSNETTLDKLTFVTSNAAFVPDKDDCLHCESGAFSSLHQVIANEYPKINCKSIDTSKDSAIETIIAEVISATTDKEVALRGDSRYVLEMGPLFLPENEAILEQVKAHDQKYSLNISQVGSVEGLEYIQEEELPLELGQVKVKTSTSSLNFKDLLKVYGQISDDVIRNTFYGDTIGMELCGEIIEVGADVLDFNVGDKVILPTPGSFTSYVNIGTDYLMKLPPNLSESEAPVLIGFITAYHGLHNIARLQKGEKVLIHNGTGGVGLAAIQVAKWLGAEIYTTAGTNAKREYLKELGIKHIYNSRSIDFFHEIKKDTDGYGVDVVLNALSGAALEKSFHLLAPYGRFIEIGKKDIGDNAGLAMKAFNEALQFAAIDIDRMLKNKIDLLKEIYHAIFERFATGDFKAIPVEIFSADKTKEAFSFMAQSKHVGKVVIDYRDAALEIKKEFSPFAHKKGLIVVTGGTGGFGFQISKSLAEKTGYNIVAVSRSGIRDLNDKKEFERLKSQGYSIYSDQLDVTSKENVYETLQLLEQEYGPLKGIVHSAVILDDAFIKDLEGDRFARVLQAKIQGAKNLANYCFELERNLDFFVSFSSISALIGNPGQANYVVANRFLDLFTAELRLKGLKAFTINWGVLGESGLLSRNENVGKLLESLGIKPLSNQVAIETFYKVISNELPQVGVFDVDWKKWSTSFKKLSESSKFKKLANNTTTIENPLKTKLLKELDSKSDEQIKEFILTKVKEGLSSILKLNSDKIEEDVSINNLGVDSLMAVEVLVMIEKHLFVELTTVDLLNGPTVSELSSLTKERLLAS